MFGYLLKKAASLVISLMLVYVPQDKYQHELDNLPTMQQRMVGMDLQGWEFKSVISPKTGQEHGYFIYPCSRPDAPTLVCLHGFNTDGSIFFRLKGLADRVSIIAYNFPEKSPLYHGSISDFTGLLNDFFSTIRLDTFALLGNSVGGAIAQHYAAADQPVTITHLFLMSTTVFGTTAENIRQIRGMADKLLPYPDYKLYYLLTKGKSILSRAEKAGFAEETPGGAVVIKHVAWYREILQSLYYYIGTEDARNIHCPVVAMHGEADRLIPLAQARTIEREIHGVRFGVVAGAGHGLIYSHADQVSAVIRGEF
jgi:pimeloyl-ACP methyl ester carboxylesterase